MLNGLLLDRGEGGLGLCTQVSNIKILEQATYKLSGVLTKAGSVVKMTPEVS